MFPVCLAPFACENCFFRFRVVVHSRWSSVFPALLGDRLYNHTQNIYIHTICLKCTHCFDGNMFLALKENLWVLPPTACFFATANIFRSLCSMMFTLLILHFLRYAVIYHFPQEPRLASLRRCPLAFKVR